MFSSKAKHEYFEYHESKKDLLLGKLEPLEECQGCGGDIFPGEEVYILDGYIIHADLDCLKSYVAPETKTIEEALKIK